MYRVKADATPRLRVRSKPNGDILGGFPPGRVVDVVSIADGWAKLKTADDLTAYVSAAYIEDTSAPPPPVVDYRKAGLHLHTGNNADACIRVYDECARAGKPLAVAVVINNTGLVDAIKRVSPSTFVVYRGGINEQTGNDFLPLVEDDNMVNFLAGEKRFNERYAPCAADAYQIANEHYSGGHPAWKIEAMTQFYLGGMAAAKARGVIITVGDFSTGTPEDAHLEIMKPMLDRAEAESHVLNYHSYAAPDVYDMTNQAEWYALRWERIIRNHPKLRVINGEFGGYHNNGPDIMAMVRQYQAMTATDKILIGYAVYTANAGAPWDTNGFNFDPHLRAYSQWHRSL